MQTKAQSIEKKENNNFLEFLSHTDIDYKEAMMAKFAHNLSNSALAVYVWYLSIMDKNRQVKHTNRTIAQALDLPERTVQRANERLVDTGLVIREQAHRYDICVTTVCNISFEPCEMTVSKEDDTHAIPQYDTADTLSSRANGIKRELDDLNKQLINSELQPAEQHQLLARIGQLEVAKRRLSRLPQPPAKPDPGAEAPSTSALEKVTIKQSSGKKTRLTDELLVRLAGAIKAMPCISAPTQLIKEIVWSIEHGKLGKHSVLHGVNAALKLLREGRWSTPFGYIDDSTTVVAD